MRNWIAIGVVVLTLAGMAGCGSEEREKCVCFQGCWSTTNAAGDTLETRCYYSDHTGVYRLVDGRCQASIWDVTADGQLRSETIEFIDIEDFNCYSDQTLVLGAATYHPAQQPRCAGIKDTTLVYGRDCDPDPLWQR